MRGGGRDRKRREGRRERWRQRELGRERERERRKWKALHVLPGTWKVSCGYDCVLRG